MAENDQEKTEDPTAKRRSQARNKGQVGKSQDFSSALILLLAALVLWFYGKYLSYKLLFMAREVFLSLHSFDLSVNNLVYFAGEAFVYFLLVMVPFSGILLFFGVLIAWAQVGFLFTWHPLKPNFLKVFGLEGFKRLVSPDKLMDLVKSLLKMAVVGLVGYQVVYSHYLEYLLLADQSLYHITSLIFKVLIEVMIKCALLLFVLGVLDLVYQKFKTKKSIKMTKQEVKDEAKQSEGDPHVRSKIKQLRQEMYRRIMMQEVPKATVVVTNPTHIAIALRFRQGQENAPVAVAKGKRKMAEKIKQTALEHDIPIVENKPLARSMFDVVIIGEEIPEEFFGPVAEILAYVYRMKETAVP